MLGGGRVTNVSFFLSINCILHPLEPKVELGQNGVERQWNPREVPVGKGHEIPDFSLFSFVEFLKPRRRV